MSELDDKLRDILDNLRGALFEGEIDKAIPQIKQVFANRTNKRLRCLIKQEGKKAFKEGHDLAMRTKFDLSFGTGNGKPPMSGAEWYDRFMFEIGSIYDYRIDDWSFTHLQVMEAAKKAAGIE